MNNKRVEEGNKQIKDYLHLYLGCQCGLKTTYRPNNYKLACIWSNGMVGVYKNGESFPVQSFNAEYIKPILRKLSDMTEEENKEYCQLIEMEIEDFTCLVESSILKFAEGTRYLISKHFDLFNLIENNLAIDKATLK